MTAQQLHAGINGEKMADLALLHIHYDTFVDMDKVVDCYAQLHARRLELKSCLC